VAPDINNSSKEERREYIKTKYHCISNCESCGLCKVFKGKEPEIVFDDYINGIREYSEIASEIKR